MRGFAQNFTNSIRRTGLACGLAERLSRPAGAAPEFEDRGGGKRQSVVAVARGPGLLRRHAARGDDERPIGRQDDLPLEPYRAEGVLREHPGAAAEHRRVVFAPSEGPDTAVTSQRVFFYKHKAAYEIAGKVH